MFKRTAITRTIASALVVVQWIIVGSAKADTNIDTLLAMLEARARAVSSISWTYNYYSLRGTPASDFSGGNVLPLVAAHRKGYATYVPTGERAVGTALFDLRTGKFKVTTSEEVFKSANSATGWMLDKRLVAFDGSVYSLGHHVPQEYTPSGAVRSTMDADLPATIEHSHVNSNPTTFEALKNRSGYPFVSSRIPIISGTFGIREWNMQLLDFVKIVRARKGQVEWLVDGQDGWALRIPVSVDGQEEGFAKYSFSPAMGGAPTRIERFAAAGWPAGEEYVFDYIKAGTGLFVPRAVRWIQWDSGLARISEFDAIRIDPPLDRTSFSLDVKDGSYVLDHERHLAYTATPGPVDEARALKQYAGDGDVANGLMPFISRGKWWARLLFGMLATLFLALIVLVVRRRRRILSVFAVMASLACC